MAKHGIKCDHEPECSKPNQYAAYAQYVEIWDGDCKLVEIVADEDPPHNLVCTECNAHAEVITIKDAKSQRDDKAQKLQGRLL